MEDEPQRLQIRPNCSLSVRGARLFFASACVVPFGMGGVLAWKGFWPILPFAGLEMALLLLDRDPIAGAALASQPTLSRFENAPRRAELYRMGEALAECVIERHRRRLGRRCKHLRIDLDPTDDATHGAQQLTFLTATTTAGVICRWQAS